MHRTTWKTLLALGAAVLLTAHVNAQSVMPITPRVMDIRSTTDDTTTFDGDGNPVVLLGNNLNGVIRAARTVSAVIIAEQGSIGRVSLVPLNDEGFRAL